VCRLIVYLGPPVTLDELLVRPEHSLLHQSYAPTHQIAGVLNADGFGAGWYDPALRAEPAVYRVTTPMWADNSFASMAGLISSGAILAAVRSATPGFPVDLSSTQPFTSGPWLFAHNGSVEGFLEGVGEELRRSLSVRRASGIRSAVDSEVLFAMTLDRLDRGATPGDAIADVVATVKQVSGGRMNLALTDGSRFAATAFGNSLFARKGPSTILASEPFDDDPSWRAVPDVSLVEGPGLAVTPL
jgi:glutamine amidotransferase